MQAWSGDISGDPSGNNSAFSVPVRGQALCPSPLTSAPSTALREMLEMSARAGEQSLFLVSKSQHLSGSADLPVLAEPGSPRRTCPAQELSSGPTYGWERGTQSASYLR